MQKLNNNKKTILIFSNTSWSLYNFRFELIEKFSKNPKYNIVLLCGDDDYKEKFNKLGLKFVFFRMNRGFSNPLYQFVTLFKLVVLLFKINPEIIFSFTVKPNIISGFYSLLRSKVIFIPNITGMGKIMDLPFFFKSLIINIYFKLLLKSRVIFVQNKRDKDLACNILKNNCIVKLPGSGTNPKKFPIKKNLGYRYKVCFVGRALKKKGVIDFIEFVKLVNQTNKIKSIMILNTLNSDLDIKQISLLCDKHGIKLLKNIDNVNKFLLESKYLIFPSTYNEGIPKTVLEALFSGMIVIAYDSYWSFEFKENIYPIFVQKSLNSLMKGYNEVESYSQKSLIEKNDKSLKFMRKKFTINKVIFEYEKACK